MQMKKLVSILLVAIMLVCSCSDNKVEPEKKSTTYSLVDQYGLYNNLYEMAENGDYALSDLDFGIDIALFEYNESQCVAQNSISNPELNKKYSFKATKNTQYVTVRVSAWINNKKTGKGGTETYYLANAFYLSAGEETSISLTSSMQTSKIEPKK